MFANDLNGTMNLIETDMVIKPTHTIIRTNKVNQPPIQRTNQPKPIDSYLIRQIDCLNGDIHHFAESKKTLAQLEENGN